MSERVLEGRVFIVTGGTQGLGSQIALHLAKQGATGLIICGRNKKNGEAVAQEVFETGCLCEYVQSDLVKEADCRRVVQHGKERYQRIDGLVNAAGSTRRGSLEDTTVKLWDFLFNVNVRAPFILTQEVVRFMKTKKTPGSIVNIISDCAHGGYPFLTAYSASKGALATFTKNVANALRFDRIRVNGISIGWMYTPNEHQVQIESGQPENWLEQVEKKQPFGRILRPQDVAYLTAYLLSEQAQMITGSIIDFDQKVIGGLG